MSGSGNQYNVLSGLTYQLGDLQIAPNFLWQKPIEGPMQAGLPSPARLRNILDDPFVVRANREQLAGELLLTFDPTPATYYYEWNNDFAEDAKFAMNAGFVYRHLPTARMHQLQCLSKEPSSRFLVQLLHRIYGRPILESCLRLILT